LSSPYDKPAPGAAPSPPAPGGPPRGLAGPGGAPDPPGPDDAPDPPGSDRAFEEAGPVPGESRPPDAGSGGGLGRLHFVLGWTGRICFVWVRRRVDQASFLGRLYMVGLRGLAGGSAQRRLVRKLTLLQVLEIFKRTFVPLSIFGLMMGVLWTVIWFDVLANVPGSSMLASLLISVHLQEITPILTNMCLVMAYCGPMTLDLGLKKCSGEFETMVLQGIAPEHALAWPRLAALVLSYPGLMLVINLASFLGAYWGIARAIDLPVVEFLNDLYLAVEPYNMFILFVKVVLIGSIMGFYCLYYGFQAPVGGYGRCPYLTRRGMVEAFFYSTFAEVMVTVLYA
jgi:phospholipid/cholesterol/gamma-HCH transport system permease protein